MRATLRHVAEEAGVSPTTVSMVLRGIEERTTPETRARVLDVAQRLNYLPVKRPSFQNRPLETGIVTLVPRHYDMEKHGLDMFTYRGIISSAREHGYNVLTMVGREAHRYSVEDRTHYLDRHSDGFIFVAPNEGDWEQALQLVTEYDIPAVVCYSRNPPAGVPYVDVDNTSAMHLAIGHLVQAGHRRVAYLSGPSDNRNEHERCRGCRNAMHDNGLNASDLLIAPGLAIGGALHEKAVAAVVESGCTGIVCFNDDLAILLWDALENRGIKVPEDVSLIGMDNTTEGLRYGLTSIGHSFIEVGRLAMETWVELKKGGDAKVCSKLTPVELIERASVRSLTS